MDLGLFIMFNKSMNFIRGLNRENFYFHLEFSNLVTNKQHIYGSYEKIQNLSSISLKLCMLCPKNTGIWGVKNTIALQLLFDKFFI